MPDWNHFRSQFPALEGRTYLNTAGGGVMAPRTAQAAGRYLEESVSMGDVGWDLWLDRSEQDRADVARIVGADPTRLAFLSSASLGFNILAQSLGSPARICALDQEFPSCTTPFLRNGASIHFLKTEKNGAFSLELLDQELADGIDAFVISSVQFANGFRADLALIGEICARRDVLFMVDATQSIGAFPVDMVSHGIDALVFSGYKWATAGYGNAVLAMSDSWPDGMPPLVGWRSARDAYALENHRLDMLAGGLAHELGHPPFPGLFTIAEALRMLDEAGIDAVSERILSLGAHLRSRMGELSIPARSADESHEQSGIVLLESNDAPRLCSLLKERNIWTSARDGGLRVSFHAYNNESDIDALCEALVAIELS